MDLKERVKEVLVQAHLMSLATRDVEGLWVADVIFVHDDALNLYWMSAPGARHSRAIEAGGEAAATVTASVAGGVPNFGIQCAGRAEKLLGPHPELLAKHYAKRGKAAPAAGGDVLQGRAWYTLAPTTLKLIDEVHFGYEAQGVPI